MSLPPVGTFEDDGCLHVGSWQGERPLEREPWLWHRDCAEAVRLQMSSYPMPQFLHMNQMMASCRQLGTSAWTQAWMRRSGEEGEEAARACGTCHVQDPIPHLLITGDTYLLRYSLQKML